LAHDFNFFFSPNEFSFQCPNPFLTKSSRGAWVFFFPVALDCAAGQTTGGCFPPQSHSWGSWPPPPGTVTFFCDVNLKILFFPTHGTIRPSFFFFSPKKKTKRRRAPPKLNNQPPKPPPKTTQTNTKPDTIQQKHPPPPPLSWVTNSKHSLSLGNPPRHAGYFDQHPFFAPFIENPLFELLAAKNHYPTGLGSPLVLFPFKKTQAIDFFAAPLQSQSNLSLTAGQTQIWNLES